MLLSAVSESADASSENPFATRSAATEEEARSGPASRSNTLRSVCSDKRLASTEPAEPAPTMMISYSAESVRAESLTAASTTREGPTLGAGPSLGLRNRRLVQRRVLQGQAQASPPCNASCNSASSASESEVLMTVPPNLDRPAVALSVVICSTMRNSAEVPGLRAS